jgi:hypothetical protein
VRALAAAIAALALAAIAHAQPASQTPDVPAGTGRIEGRVVQGDAGVADVEVVLYALNADGVPGLRRTRSDAAGHYLFDKVATGEDVAYLVGARHRGIPVPGDRVAFAPGSAVATAEIRLFDLTPDPRTVRLREQVVRLYREAQGLRVEETFAITNESDHIVFVPAAERKTKGPALRAQLPAQATDFRMPLGVEPEGLAHDGQRLAYFGPFYPGPQDLVWSYRVPSQAGAAGLVHFAFELEPARGVEKLVVLVPEDLGELLGAPLSVRGAEDDAGRRVRRYESAPPRGRLAIRLDAAQASLDPGAISVSEVRVVAQADDAAIDVTETHQLEVAAGGLRLGTIETPLLRIPLPAGAADVRFGSEAQGLEFAPHPEGGVALLGTVSPGPLAVQLGYRVPVRATPARLERQFTRRVPLVTVYLADTGRLAPEAERLHRARSAAAGDLTYLAWEAFDVEPGEPVALTIATLAPRANLGPLARRAGTVLAAFAVVAFLVAPLLGRARVATAAPTAPAHGEREALYESLRDLDHDLETGKVSPADHARLRAELRARAIALMRDEERARGEGEPHPPSASGAPEAAPHCESCAASAQPGQRFCGQCGAPLAASPA